MVKRKKGIVSILFDCAEVEELSAREGAQELLKRERKKKIKFRKKLGFVFRTGKIGLGGFRRKEKIIF